MTGGRFARRLWRAWRLARAAPGAGAIVTIHDYGVGPTLDVVAWDLERGRELARVTYSAPAALAVGADLVRRGLRLAERHRDPADRPEDRREQRL